MVGGMGNSKEAKRYEVVRRIENFLGQFGQNRAIITSRPAGYKRDFFRTEEFPHYELQPFDDPKIKEFINHWYDSRVPDKEEARRRKDSLKKALSEQDRIKLLARNPLLLTIIALIHRYQALLPKERYKLYDKAVETLLTSWDANKELSNHAVLKYLELDDLRRLMESLAYWIHTQGSTGDKEGGTLIDRDELIDKLSRDIRTLKQIQLYEAKEEAKRFVDFIRDRTGLLNEQGQDCYAFVHKTFQEYLCAQEINYQRENEDDFGIVLSHIEDHLHNPHWREVLLLLIAQQKPKQAARAMRKILDQNSPYECWLHRDLLFAGNCLAENPKNLKVADNGLSQEILEALVKLEATDLSKVGYRIRNQVFQSLCTLSESDFETKALQLLKDKASCINKGRLQQYRVALGEKEAVKDLLTLTKNEDSRSSAINILINLDDTHEVVRALLECLHDEDSEMRYWAAFAFLLGNKQSIDSEEVVQALLERLHDGDSKVRFMAISVLGNQKNPSKEVVRELLTGLQDEDSAVRYNAASALSKLGNTSEELVRELLTGLQDEDSAVRSNAVSAVGNLKNGSEEVVRELLARLQDEDSDVRSRATSALSKMGNTSEQVVRELLATLQDEDSAVRSTASYALSNLGNISEEVVRKLLAALQDEDSDVRSGATSALGDLENPPEEVARELLARLQDEDSGVRSSACYALGGLENPSEEVIQELLARLQDENSNVRSGASYALGNLENPSEEIVRELLGRLQDEDSGVRSSAVFALSRLGNASKEVISELLARLEDKDSHLRYSAASIWGKLSKKSGNVITDVAQWIEQHQDSEYVGNGIDALWHLVAGEPS
jgi:HEAT repeat protein